MRSEIRILLAGQDEGRFTRDGDRLRVEIIDTGYEDGRGDACKAILQLDGEDFRMVRVLMMEKPTC